MSKQLRILYIRLMDLFIKEKVSKGKHLRLRNQMPEKHLEYLLQENLQV